MAGNFLKDEQGQLVVVNGSPIISKVLARNRKPNSCQGCRFSRWCVGDTCFIIQNRGGGMEWLCPNCALRKGLPDRYYVQNKYATPPPLSTAQSEDDSNPHCSQLGWQSMTGGILAMFSSS